ncbi:MAG TPA: hypothetical protein VGR76_23160 [Candidatus Angelobacter sp.]|jgi:hypothetical protein|nr:hypothetical protein [Candidatus Angelobacter sp.]
MPREILFEGLTPEAILGRPAQEIEQLVLTGEPIIFTAGSARILGEFRRSSDRLNVTLAQIEGGGEGVLPALTILIEKFARSQSLTAVEWIVHAVHCAKPNLKLKRVLERKGFVVKEVDGTTAYYHYQKL